MPKNVLEVLIVGNVEGLRGAYAKAGMETEALGSKFGSMGKAAAVGAGVAGVGLLVKGLEGSVKAAVDEQASMGKLTQSFKNSGLSAKTYAKQIDDLEASGRKLGFSTGDTNQALSRLVTATGSVTKASSELSVAQDIARFKHIDLTSASQLLAAALTGSQRAAKMLGITVIPTSTNLDRLKASHVTLTGASGKLLVAHAKLQDKMATGNAVIDAVTAKVKGQADAFGNTAAGAQDKMRASVDALQVSLGTSLLPAVTKVTDAITWAVTWLTKHKTITMALILSVAALSTTLIAVGLSTKAMYAATKIWTAMTKLATVGQWLLNAALDANPVGLVVLAILALAGGLVVAWKKSETFRDIVKGAFDVVKKAVWLYLAPFFLMKDGIVWLGNNAVRIFKAVRDGVEKPLGAIVGFFKPLLGALGTIKRLMSWIMDKAKDFLGAFGKIGGFLGKIPGLASGGPVSMGQAYMVGESGPELFVPGTSGSIIPNGALSTGGGGGGGSGVTVVVNVAGSVTAERDLVDAIRLGLQRTSRGLVTSSVTPGVGKLGLA